MKQGKNQSTYRNRVAIGLVLLLLNCTTGYAVDRYVSLEGGHVPPFTDWANAATNIQEAIESSVEGDVIWVTNGVYAVGGKVMAGDLTNRVALDKALTVRSVNGPTLTTIKGQWDAANTNGPGAVRCAWLTNGATLHGFTLFGGATRLSSLSDTAGGGGAWCSSNAVIANCIIKSNSAGYGGGVFQGVLNNCLLSGNRSVNSGGGAYNSVLNNCSVVSNSGWGIVSQPFNLARLTNSIVYFNTPGNYQGSLFSYCCTTPLPAGGGNIANAPQLLSDGVHLTSTSPCRGAGTNLVSGTDIDGQAWADPPSIGCDEWQPEPVIFDQPQVLLTGNPVGFRLTVGVVGQEPFVYWWTKDGALIENDDRFAGAHTPNLQARGVEPSDAGGYQVVVSNVFGVVTSSVANVVIHYVDSTAVAPQPPYLNWGDAATNIQNAIDVALPGGIVLVASGTYGTGGKVMGGDLTNRVALDKAILVHSLSGSQATIIQGLWNPVVTNGPAAVRCAWLTNGAILSGFTLRGGATRSVSPAVNQQMNGGGVWGASTNATVANCAIVDNSASYQGGGAYQITLINSTVMGNRAVGSGTPGAGVGLAGSGGGAARCNLINCVITMNSAEQGEAGGVLNSNLKNCALTKNSSFMNGGAASSGTLVNCTVTGNTSSGYSSGYGSAVYGASLTNCLVWGNLHRTTNPNTNYANCSLSYCNSVPLPTGEGNLSIDPQLLADGVHALETSPCRGAGTNEEVSGTDIDGQPWENPPSIGCDEWHPQPAIIGEPKLQVWGNPARLLISGVAVAGEEPFSIWWSKDGSVLEESPRYSSTQTVNLIVNDLGPLDAGFYQMVASNAFGVATSAVVQVVVRCVDGAGPSPASPFSDWATAATTIQDAIDAASPGEIILVTNGVYSTGGKVMAGGLMNRVALDKPLTVASVNGATATVIEGAWDPATTNGPLAVRGAWLTDGAILSGFTLLGGATLATGDSLSDSGPLQCGGGVWCVSSNAVVANCVLTGNAASASGGGAFQGTLENSVVTNNTARFGGGLSYGIARNCLISFNEALNQGGGAYRSSLNNCTVTFNYTCSGCSPGSGAGTYFGSTRNSIVLFNTLGRYGYQYANYYVPGAQYAYCLTDPAVAGPGNITGSPQFLDLRHVSIHSTCRGAGSPLYANGTDLDGEPWSNPPSIGCDEVVESGLTGPLSVGIYLDRALERTILLVNRPVFFGAQIIGRVAWYEWLYGDGTAPTTSGTHIWANPGTYTVTLTAYNTDNPDGVSTNLLVDIVLPDQPLLQSAASTPGGFQFEFSGQYEARYSVEMTTNLTPPINWQVLQTIFFSTGGVHQISDPRATNSAGFYRVRAQ